MTVRPLAALPKVPASADPQPVSQHVPSAREWEEQYPEIKRLYVRERWKLRPIMTYMERQHGFKATEQMYKKRFSKWGFQKNTRRSASTAATVCSQKNRQKQQQTENEPNGFCFSLHAFPRPSKTDTLSLGFLINLRHWNSAFFESAFSDHKDLASRLAWPERAKEISFALKLVSDLLTRGQGVMAGRLARKAFLLVEDMLELEGPALVWNLLEMMHHMLALGHQQLFSMLVTHLDALVKQRLPENHPLRVLICDLQRLGASAKDERQRRCVSCANSSLSLPSSRRLSKYDRGGSTRGLCDSDDLLLRLLKEAWTSNAENILHNFDPRLSELYFHLHWETCSINLPSVIVDVAKRWLIYMDAQQDLKDVKIAGCTYADSPESMSLGLSSLQPLTVDTAPPLSYEMLVDGSLTAFWQHWQTVIDQEASPPAVAGRMLHIMPAVVKAKFLQIENASATHPESAWSLRSQASSVACVVRALMVVQTESDDTRIEALPGAVNRIRWIVTLHEFAYGDADPQVIQEMWLLGDTLAAVGETEKAEEVKQCVMARLEAYTRDLGVDLA